MISIQLKTEKIKISIHQMLKNELALTLTNMNQKELGGEETKTLLLKKLNNG